MRKARVILGCKRASFVALSALTLVHCGSGDHGILDAENGPSVFQYDATAAIVGSTDALIVLVVDDRSIPRAAALRNGAGAAIRALCSDAIGNAHAANFDPASWHPVDIGVVVVPASDTSSAAIASVATDAALGWTSVQATSDGADALAAAVDAHVSSLAAMPGGAFHPLERAWDVLQLVTASRPPLDAAEERIMAVIGTRSTRRIGVAIIAASDDESGDTPASYWLGTPDGAAVAGLATNDGADSVPSAATTPRLAQWAEGKRGSPVDGCFEGTDAPFSLFHATCVDYRLACDGRPIEQTAPGLGDCAIEVEAIEPNACEAARAWLDPVDADGIRRPRQTPNGARVCEVQPVAPEAMDRCIHSIDCPGCGSGWCVTEVFDTLPLCQPGSMARPIRWVGGALPSRGTVHTSCRETKP